MITEIIQKPTMVEVRVGAPGLQGETGPDGPPGPEIELRNNGTHIQWRVVGAAAWINIIALSAITGPAGANGTNGTNGTNGQDGREVELQVATGNLLQWRYVGGSTWTTLLDLDTLVGPQGPAGQDGADGADGLSAYEIAVNNGFVGTESQWLASLIGEQGAPGANGADGAPGNDGLSAYEVAVNNGFTGTEADWLNSLVGAPGSNGTNGEGVPVGGSAGQFLKKATSTDYDTTWANLGVGDVSGLGNAATRSVGTTAGTVAAGDDARFSAAGKIVKVVRAVKTDTATVTGTTPATVFSASITPASASNRIAIVAMLSVGQATNNAAYIDIVRGSTAILQGDTAGSRRRVTTTGYTNQAGQFQSAALVADDLPGVTTSTTYNIQLSSNTTGSVFLNRSATDTDSNIFARGASSMLLIEYTP